MIDKLFDLYAVDESPDRENMFQVNAGQRWFYWQSAGGNDEFVIGDDLFFVFFEVFNVDLFFDRVDAEGFMAEEDGDPPSLLPFSE